MCLTLNDVEEYRLLRAMPIAHDANHLAKQHQRCLKGTRTDILSKLESWASDPLSSPVYWLSGYVGSGKSTIAQSFCERTYSDGLLGASYFCSRDYSDKSNLHLIFTTLSFQLAYLFPEIRAQVIAVLKSRPYVAREPLHNQFMALFLQPLRITQVSTLIVLDALDECKDAEPVSAVLSLISQHIQSIPNVKFFISSRAEPSIRAAFRLSTLREATTFSVLHDIGATSVDHDIEIFFRVRLAEAMANRSDVNLLEAWPSQSEIEMLTITSGQCFLFAATSVAFILSPIHQPTERLRAFTSSAHPPSIGAFPCNRISRIDQCYFSVLDSAGYSTADDLDYERLRRILGSILLVVNPLSITDHSLLLGLTPSTIRSLLRPQHAVVRVPEDDLKPVTTFHKSFYEFLLDPHRCRDSRFYIDENVHHRILALGCLRIINEQLEKTEVGDSKSYTAPRRIGSALQYACCYWPEHLLKSKLTSADDEVWHLLKGFLAHRQISWVNVLISLGGEVIMSALDSVDALYNGQAAYFDEIPICLLKVRDYVK
ncbi:hypothetical protein H0H87_009468 [Tephrocybe sp. NHM501043]|nr:hypothetical protein H0H87_009468 [Tephrocybe sp. NHM501043]